MNLYARGGGFLLGETPPGEVYTPEDFGQEHRMIADTASGFATGEVAPRIELLEAHEPGLVRALLLKAGELGLLSCDVPEEYGGLGLDRISSLVVMENIIKGGGSFAVAYGAHTGIGTLPIVFFGTSEQKRRYLPGLASGEKVAAYALTEPGAGSDALAIRTRAALTGDGRHYILNGSKQFVSNGGIADVFVTYAKVDGERFTAFIVDRDTPGVSVGPEEKKLGIKGSSTTAVHFEDAAVPVENVLGEVGRGHVVAFNILNLGRFKLAAGCVGSAKLALEKAISYASERVQFGKSISEFGLIKEKIATMGIQAYLAESMVYRTGGLIEAQLGAAETESGDGAAIARAMEEYAIECSVNKVYASEALDWVADQALQVYGGYGYIEEYPVERIWRDARINRIFEGTNEINRLLIPAMLMRKALKGELPLVQEAQRLARQLVQGFTPAPGVPGSLGAERGLLEMLKKVFLLTAGAAVQRYGEKIDSEQEILAIIADMVIDIYALESGLLRAMKEGGGEGEGIKVAMVKAAAGHFVDRFEAGARRALAAIERGDALRIQLAAVRKLTRYLPENTIGLKRAVAERLVSSGKYAV